MFVVNALTHQLEGQRFVLSPNHNDRPVGTEIDLIVIHGISLPPGEFGGAYIEQFFMNQLDLTEHSYFEQLQGMQVSAHVVIDRLGMITQYVPFHKRAWHAGASCFLGRNQCNDFSIGIELEGLDTIPYTASQYAVLGNLVQTLMKTYPAITADRIVGHQDIAPGRKTDPGPCFDWSYFRERIFKFDGEGIPE